ncbi:MAG: TatD family deoxyribonuclease [Actinobacteria bacterium]|nr:TatD family deoxyribonuclease [Actinomycetota bacterium]
MIDSHAHLGLCEPSPEELVAAAREAGVDRILTIGLGEDSNPGVIELAREHEQVFAAVGRHPNSAAGFYELDAEELERLAASEEVVAVGETGLDWYREGAPADEQRRAFLGQIRVAQQVEKPLVVHLRDREQSEDAATEAFSTLEAEGAGLEIVLHCFSAGPRWAARAAELGWYCSFAGNLTYPSAERVREAAALVPDELLLVETDSPYLAPQPSRGKPNQPANVVATAERLAEVRETDYERIESLVTANAARLFGW